MKQVPLRLNLLAAAGFSTKAQGHLSKKELDDALEQVLEKIAGESDEDWRDELLYRYLLAKGDSLGGSMRNFTGALAVEKIHRWD